MKVGFVVDGRAEFASIPNMYGQIADLTGHTLLNPIYADMQPFAPVGQIVRACKPGFRQLEGRAVDRVIVLIDRETRAECPGALATSIHGALATGLAPELWVVVKNRMFENWLVADPAALDAQPARFQLSQADRNRVAPNRADTAPADAILARASGHDYSKVEDAKRILRHFNIKNGAENSRSLRRLCRALELPAYRNQSRHPN